jgi:hypothetical protein
MIFPSGPLISHGSRLTKLYTGGVAERPGVVIDTMKWLRENELTLQPQSGG